MKTPIKSRGLTLVELLISVVLVAMLLTAVASAVRASLGSIHDNNDAEAFSQTTRNLMLRITREIRTAEAVDFTAGSGQLVIYPPDDGSGLDEVRYTYTSATRTLTYTRTVSHDPTSVAVLTNQSTPVQMTAFAVAYDTAVNGAGVTYTRRVRVTMTFLMNGVSTPLVCSAAPRRNLTY